MGRDGIAGVRPWTQRAVTTGPRGCRAQKMVLERAVAGAGQAEPADLPPDRAPENSALSIVWALGRHVTGTCRG